MTIASTNNRNAYTGNDTTETYSYTFAVFLNTDLKVLVKNTTTDVETELTLTTDFTVTGAGDVGGGSIVLVDAGQAWISASSYLDTGYTLTVRRVIELKQETDIRNQGDFYPEAHEDQFDKQVMIDQQQQDEIERAVKLPETILVANFNPELPGGLEDASQVTIVTNAAGDGFEIGPTATEVSSAQGYATAASSSASAASTSETNAAASAGAASASETNAGTSETNAAASAGAASTSETNAGTSETNAAASAGAASTSETNAGTSETNAAASAGAASTSETNAGTSEGNASTSASNASTSETNAGISETNAAASASAAASSAAASSWNDVAHKSFADSPITIADADVGKLYAIDCGGGNVVVNLPSVAGLTLSGPWSIGFKKTEGSTNTITINRNGTDTIDGNTSVVVDLEESGVTLVPDTDPTPDEWTALSFGTISLGIVPNTNGGTGVDMSTFSQGSVLFLNASKLVTESSNLNWNDGTSTLGITGIFNLDNIQIDGNSIKSTDANGNIIFDPNGAGNVQVNSSFVMEEQSTPGTPSATYHNLYFKSDGQLYRQDSTPTEKRVGELDVVVITDSKSSGTHGGTATSGSYATRTLNTVQGDTSIVSLLSNQFTLQAGKYSSEVSAPAYQVNAHKVKLRNITDSTEVIGASSQAGASDVTISRSEVKATFTITSAKVYEIQHRVQTTASTTGFGLAITFGDAEIYTIVKITKLK